MTKKRLTTHSGREGKDGVFNPKHNDRNFNYWEADWINPDKTPDNIYINFITNKSYTHEEKDKENIQNFEEMESNFYEENFSKWLNKKNKRYEKNRHKERIKTMDETRKNKLYCPEETMFQLGSKDNFNEEDSDKFMEVMDEYLEWFNDSFSPHIRLLSCSLHIDETTPHFHLRKVYIGEDKDGNLLPSQAQALKKLGIERPDPSKKKSRYNNPKMAFTAMTRDKLMDICEEHGLSIEREPETGGRKHLEKQDYILYKQKKDIEKQKEDIEKGESELDDIFMEKMMMSKELNRYKKENKKLKTTIENQKKDIKELENNFIDFRNSLVEGEEWFDMYMKNPENAYSRMVLSYLSEKELTTDFNNYVKKPIQQTRKNVEKERKKARIRLQNVNLHNDKEEDKGMDF